MMTSPPLPPSPPLGPPRGTNFSRRNARQPLPPLPAFTRILTSSMNNCYSAGWMLTNFPRRPRSRNWMTPVIFANRVSSLPRPTFSPGLIRVPRWRTMIEPPGTNWPPNAFTPSRCELESRPFLELPNPFLCAIPDQLLFLFLGGRTLLGGLRIFLWRRSLGLGLCRFAFFRSSLLIRLGRFLRKLGRSKLLAIKSDFRDAHRGKGLPVSAQFLVL